jgi:hypothetical protein
MSAIQIIDQDPSHRQQPAAAGRSALVQAVVSSTLRITR